MAARTRISDLPKGHQFPATALALSAAGVERYLDAVEDANAVYAERGLAPPLAVAARALGLLLETLELPPGTLHTGQEIDVHSGIAPDAALTLTGRIAQRSERAGAVFSVIEFQLSPEGLDEPVVTGRTTVIFPGSAS
jgi:hypothetical protein